MRDTHTYGIQAGWRHLRITILAAIAFAGVAPWPVANAQVGRPLPPEFTPRELSSDRSPCAPIAICDGSYLLNQCRELAASRFGANRYTLFHWQRPLRDPIPLLAIGSSAIAQCMSTREGQRLVSEGFRVIPVGVFSRQFDVFFSQPSPLWANAPRRNLWLDLFIQSLDLPPTPPPRQEPPAPLPEPPVPPKTPNKPPRIDPPPPVPATGNLRFFGTGTIVATEPMYPSLQGCEVSSGRCATFAPPGRKVVVSVSPFDQNGKALSHIVCSSRLVNIEARKSVFTLTTPSDFNDSMNCKFFYGSDGGHTIKIVGNIFSGEAIYSVPSGLISCNGTTERQCEAKVAPGTAFSLVYPESILPVGGTKKLKFANYYCESADGRQTVSGPWRKRTQNLGKVSASWSCGAFYYETLE